MKTHAMKTMLACSEDLPAAATGPVVATASDRAIRRRGRGRAQSIMARALPVVLVASVATAQGASSGPCYEPSFGANLALTDDSVAVGLPLGFSFPMPGGGTTSVVSVSSNGFVWLGTSSDPGCCSGNVMKLVTQMARIAPLWMDLDPGAGGAVWFNTIPAAGGVPASAVITWDAVPEFSQSAPMTFQLQLYADGSFITYYDPNIRSAQPPVTQVALTGVSQGAGAAANIVDLLQATLAPIDSGANPTLCEEFQFLGSFDLAMNVWTYVPNGQGGYLFAPKAGCSFAASQPFGAGCPQPATAYEVFDTVNPFDLANTALEFTPTGGGAYTAMPTTGFFTGYTAPLALGDDDVQGPFGLPFSFVYPGGVTTAIDISSNGFIWLQGGSNTDPRCCDGDPFRLVNDPASICGLWMDLFPPGAPSTGGIFFDVVGATEAHITWVDVPELGSAPGNSFQITLRSNGTFRLSWGGNVAIQSHNCLVGFTSGGPGADPGPTDLSQGPFSTPVGGAPLKFTAQQGSRPKLGAVFGMDISGADPSAVFGLLVLGFTQYLPGIDLGPLGMPGCHLYASLDNVQAVTLAGSPTPATLSLPANPALSGLVLHAQAAALTAGANPLGLVASNGLMLQLGIY